MSILGEKWDKADNIAEFRCKTSGPEHEWDVMMRKVDGMWVVYEPFANRLMWFTEENEACTAFASMVRLALCDADGGVEYLKHEEE